MPPVGIVGEAAQHGLHGGHVEHPGDGLGIRGAQAHENGVGLDKTIDGKRVAHRLLQQPCWIDVRTARRRLGGGSPLQGVDPALGQYPLLQFGWQSRDWHHLAPAHLAQQLVGLARGRLFQQALCNRA